MKQDTKVNVSLENAFNTKKLHVKLLRKIAFFGMGQFDPIGK